MPMFNENHRLVIFKVTIGIVAMSAVIIILTNLAVHTREMLNNQRQSALYLDDIKVQSGMKDIFESIDICARGEIPKTDSGNITIAMHGGAIVLKNDAKKCNILIGSDAVRPSEGKEFFLNIGNRFCANFKTKKIVQCPRRIIVLPDAE